MTLKDIEAIPKELLVPDDVSKFLGVDAQSIRNQARKDPHMLGFPVIVVGERFKIPKEGFVRYVRGMHLIPRKDVTP